MPDPIPSTKNPSYVPKVYVDAVKKLEKILSQVSERIKELNNAYLLHLEEVMEDIRLHLFLQTLAYSEMIDETAGKWLLIEIFKETHIKAGEEMHKLYKDLRIRSLGKKEVIYRDPTSASNPDREMQLIDSKATSGTYIAEREEYKKYKDPIVVECQLRGKNHLSAVVSALMDYYARLTIVTDAGMPAQAIGIKPDKLFFDGLFALAEKILHEQKYKVALKYGLTIDDINEPTVDEVTFQVLRNVLKKICDEKFPRTGVDEVFMELYGVLEDLNSEKSIGAKQKYVKRIAQLKKAVSAANKDFPEDFIYVEGETTAYFGSKDGYRKAQDSRLQYISYILNILTRYEEDK